VNGVAQQAWRPAKAVVIDYSSISPTAKQEVCRRSALGAEY
jgi:3-hydroxyisobutyrate dehydrogenase-like beta-hydroxyacid dehydrogenase